MVEKKSTPLYYIEHPITITITTTMQRFFNTVTVTPEFWYAAVAFLFACMIWVSPSDDVLGKAIMVAVIIALTMYHRIAGILAVIAVIALMQTMQTMKPMQPTIKREGFNPLIPTPPPITFASAAEFREKYCMKGVAQGPTAEMSTEYMLSPALFDDNNGKPQVKLEVIKQMNLSTMNAANSCKSDPPNSTNSNDYITLSNMCDPGCMWTTNPIPVPTNATKPPNATNATNATEGFTPMLRPHIRKAKHAVSDGMNTLKSGASRLRRKMF